MRARTWLWGAVVAAAVGACSDVKPCTTCPKMEGTWRFTFTPQSSSADCATLVPAAPPDTATFTRSGARVSGTLGTIDMVGTVYDTWHFVLNGTTRGANDAGTVSIGLSGTYLENLPDAGSDGSLRGVYSSTEARAAQRCDAELSYTAVR